MPSSYTESLFASDDTKRLSFTEYDDNTARIYGTSMLGSCTVDTDVWFKDKKNWATWSVDGGDFKKKGRAGTIAEILSYYVKDDT